MSKHDELMKSYDKERYHMENLINSRFNFLLVILSAVIISIATIKDLIILETILIVSTFISFFFSLTIARAHAKFSIIMNEIINDKKNSDHPAKKADDEVKKIKCFIFRMFWLHKSKKGIIGYFLPFFISLLLFSSIILTYKFQDKILNINQNNSSKILIIKKQNINESLEIIQSIKSLNNEENKKIIQLEKQFKILDTDIDGTTDNSVRK